MSTAPLGIIGSITTGQLQQARSADGDRAVHDVSSQSRALDSSRSAENASGVGEMEQEGEASDRDADGRRLWERQSEKRDDGLADASELPETPRSKDPSGDAGSQIDLSG